MHISTREDACGNHTVTRKICFCTSAGSHKVGPNSPPAPSGVCCSQARHISPGPVNFEKLNFASSCVIL